MNHEKKKGPAPFDEGVPSALVNSINHRHEFTLRLRAPDRVCPIALAIGRAKIYGTCTVVIKRSHHPLAAAWPTDRDPVMFDVCQSITTNIMTRRLQAEGRKFPGQWVIDHEGNPSDDPAVMFQSPAGASLPTGEWTMATKGTLSDCWWKP